MYSGHELEDDRALESYGISELATLHLSLRLLGGGKKKKKKNYTTPKKNKRKHKKVRVESCVCVCVCSLASCRGVDM